MATYYWVGTGTWDTSSTTNWAASSGGAGGAGFPTSADAVIFDAGSAGGTCTLGADVSCLTMTMTGFTGTLAFSTYKISLAGNAATIYTGVTTATITGTKRIDLTYAGGTGTRTLTPGVVTAANAINFYVTAGTDTVTTSGTNAVVNDFIFTGFSGTLTMPSARQIGGSLTLSSTMTVSASGSTLAFFGFVNNITCNGKTLDCPILNDGIMTFIDTFTQGSSRTLTLRGGTINGNGQNATIGSFALSAGTKTLTIGSGTWTVAGTSWNANTNVAGLTVTASTGTISMTSASAKTFQGGGKAWPTLNQGGSGALTIQQSNTFANITDTVQPATITLTSGTTQTVTDFGVSGTAGNLITLNASTPGSQATLSDSSGTNSVSYVNITDIAATGGASWQAYTENGNVDGGNNTGWLFAPAVASLIDSVYELRSFTEKRRF